MPATKYIVGLDDIATGTQACLGWTYFAVQEARVSSFESSVSGLLGDVSLDCFHAKNLQLEERPAYDRFLGLIRAEIEHQSILASMLVDKATHKSLSDRFGDLSDAVLERILTLTSAKQREAIQPYFVELAFSYRALKLHDSTCAARFVMDRHSKLKKLVGSEVVYLPVGLSEVRLLSLLLEAYGKRYFPDSFAIDDHPVEVVCAKDSALVQAADVIGNFAMNYIFVVLGKRSERREAKAKLFEKHFGDAIRAHGLRDKIRASVQLEGERDLRLRDGGRILFEFALEGT